MRDPARFDNRECDLDGRELAQSAAVRTGFGQDAELRPMGELVDAVQALSLARSGAEIQAIVRSSARRLTGADGATFVLRDGTRCFYADEDAISPLWKGQRFPMTQCISGWAMTHRTPAVIEDIYADDRIPHDAYRRTFVKSVAMVPIRTADRTVRADGVDGAHERGRVLARS